MGNKELIERLRLQADSADAGIYHRSVELLRQAATALEATEAEQTPVAWVARWHERGTLCQNVSSNEASALEFAARLPEAECTERAVMPLFLHPPAPPALAPDVLEEVRRVLKPFAETTDFRALSMTCTQADLRAARALLEKLGEGRE